MSGREDDAQLDRRMRAGKLESLGALAGGIAHEFNNLLAGILGNAQLLLLELPPGSELRDRLADIERAAIKASSLTNQMLAFSGEAAFELVMLDLSTLAVETDSLLQRLTPAGTRIHYRLCPQVPSIWGDASQMRQVLINLVINAAEAYGGKPGTVEVTTGREEVGEGFHFEGDLVSDLPAGRYAYIEVADRGSGMDRATRQRIFDPFFSTKFAGRGLGLAAVLGVIRSHRGAVGVRSEHGKGTSFKVWFPLAPALPRKAPQDPADLEQWRGEGTVFVVDDEERVRSVLRAVLKRWGFAVVTARNGREAVEIFRERSDTIRAVLLDMIMPEMNGDETFSIMRHINPYVPVIMITGYAEAETMRILREHGLADVIHKPFEVIDLIGRLKEVLESGAVPAS